MPTTPPYFAGRRRVGVGRIDDGAGTRVQDRGARVRKPRPSLCGELGLSRLLGRLHLRDLALDRRQQLPPLGELALDRRLLGRTLGDEPRLLDVRRLEARSALLDGPPVGLHLRQDLGALVRDAVHRVDPRDQLVDRARAEQYLEPVVLARPRCTSGRARSESICLRTRQILAREPELELVLPQVALDLAELLVGEVVRVDRPLEVRVEPLDLSEDALRLRLPSKRPMAWHAPPGRPREPPGRGYHHNRACRINEPDEVRFPATTGAPEGGRYVTSAAD